MAKATSPKPADRKPKKKSTLAGAWIPEACTKMDLSILLGVSVRTLTDLDAKGVLVKAGKPGVYLARQSVAAYVRRLIEAAAGRGHNSENPMASERLVREKIGRRMDEIELAKAEGNILTLDEVSESWTSLATLIRSRVLSIPGRARQRIPGMTVHDAEILKTIVRDVLLEVSEEAEAGAVGADAAEIKP